MNDPEIFVNGELVGHGDEGMIAALGRMIGPRQLTIDGREVPYPLPPPKHLTTRQHDFLLVLTAGDDPMTTADVRRFFADASGAMRRLEALGLVVHVARGRWAAA